MAAKKKKRRKKRPSLASYESYLERAGGIEACALCGTLPKKRKLDRDHSHRTGQARSLLCVRCNKALPYWISSEWLDKAAKYLKEYGE